MMQDGTKRPWDLGHLVLAALVVVCLTLTGMILWRKFGPHDRADGTSGAATPEAELSEPSSPQVRPQSEEGAAPPQPAQGESPAAPGTEAGTPGNEPGRPPAGTARSQPNTQLRESGALGSPSGAGIATRSAPRAAGASSLGSPQATSSKPGDSRAGGSAMPSSGVQTPGASAYPGQAPPPAAAAATPVPSPTPDPKKPAEDEESGSDRTPPALEALRFDPPVVQGGSVTTFTVQASDDMSGVKAVWGEIRSPNRLATLPFSSRDASRGAVTSFRITVPREAETGVWYVSWISLTDGADNTNLIQAPSSATAPPGGTFTVYSSESDSTAPEVLQVSFDKAVVLDGERNVIKVEVRDDSSGVASILGACQSPSKSALIWFHGALNPDSGIWAGDIVIPSNADCGEWTIQQLSAKDKAGNTALLAADSPVLARAGFRVAFRDCDSTAPTLDAFDLTPTIVSSQTKAEILVTARVSDVGSGAVSMTGYFEGPVSKGGQAPRNYFNCAPDPNDPQGPWTGKVEVPQFAAKGTWKVGWILLQDKALNSRGYSSADPVVSSVFFEVQ
jgi:hypothetical protein